MPSAFDCYQASITTLNRVAEVSTGIVQNGSLPTYLAVILLTVLVLRGLALTTRRSLTRATASLPVNS